MTGTLGRADLLAPRGREGGGQLRAEGLGKDDGTEAEGGKVFMGLRGTFSCYGSMGRHERIGHGGMVGEAMM